MARMSTLGAWAGVARAPFLLLPVALVAAGVAAAAYDDRAFVLPSVLALVGLVALHAAVNAFNEASDMQTGIDVRTVRTPFSGGSGTLPSGALSSRTMTGATDGRSGGAHFMRTAVTVSRGSPVS